VEDLIPAFHGGRIRTLRLASALQEVVDVTVLAPTAEKTKDYTFQGMKFKLKSRRKAARFSGRISTKPRLGAVHLKPILDSVLLEISSSRPAFIVWSHSYLAAVGMKKVRDRYPDVIHIVDFANVEALRFKSLSMSKSGYAKLLLILEFLKALLWEKDVARTSDLNLAITLVESNYIENSFGSHSLLTPNGIDAKEFQPPREDAIRLLSAANWDYFPNAEGLLHFLKEDWPLILSSHPDAQLQICGKAKTDFVAKIEKSLNTTYLGYVEDLSATYTGATAFLAPTRTGAGSQLKVAEALAHGRVVIGPEYLAREVEDPSKAQVILPTADYVETLKLLRDSLEWRSAAAHNLSKVYSWERSLNGLVEWVRFRA